jgi:hypothetical protein
MKKVFILFSLAVGLFVVSTANAQTNITLAKGEYKKTITLTIPAKGNKSFSTTAKNNQIINVLLSGDIATSKTNEFSVIASNLTNGEENVDEWQDGDGYLSIFAGRTGTYIFSVSNSSNRARTFKMQVSVTDDKRDYLGE